VKTISLKKVSAVAVASLGFGLLSVVPAQAAAITTSVGTVGTATQAGVVGTAATSTVGFTTAANTSAGATLDTFTGTTVTLTVPTGSTVTLADRDGSYSTATTAAFATTGGTTNLNAQVNTTSGAVSQSAASASAVTGGAVVAGTVTVIPDVPGLYVINMDTGAADAKAYIQAAGVAGTVGTSGLGTTALGATVNGLATFTFTSPSTTSSGDIYRFVSSGVGAITGATGVAADGTSANNPTEISGASGNWSAGATWTRSNASAGTATINLASSVAGAQTVSVTKINTATGAPTAAGSITVTWGATPVLSVANSTIYKASSTTAPTSTTDATAIVADATAGTQRANILVTVKDSANNALNGQVITAALSGPGLVAWDDDGTGNGTARGSISYDTTTGNSRYLVVNGDGTGGVATITFSIGTTVLGTETITFYGAVAKYTASANVIAVPGTATTDAVNVIATDAAGVVVPSATIYAFSSSTTVASVETSDTTAASAVAEANVGTAGSYTSAKAIGTAGFTVTPAAGTTASSVTITFGDASTLATSTVTTTAVVGIGAIEAATVALTANKTSYAPGEAVTLTLTYRDSLGRLTGTNPGTTLVASSSSSVGLGGASLPSAGAIATKVGTKTYAVFAPLTGGPVSVTVTSGTDATHLASAARSVASTVTFSVTDANAALLTQIDALNAKIVALNALIAKIMKKLGVR